MRGISLHSGLQDDSVILDEVFIRVHDVLGREREREREREGGGGGGGGGLSQCVYIWERIQWSSSIRTPLKQGHLFKGHCLWSQLHCRYRVVYKIIPEIFSCPEDVHNREVPLEVILTHKYNIYAHVCTCRSQGKVVSCSATDRNENTPIINQNGAYVQKCRTNPPKM